MSAASNAHIAIAIPCAPCGPGYYHWYCPSCVRWNDGRYQTLPASDTCICGTGVRITDGSHMYFEDCQWEPEAK